MVARAKWRENKKHSFDVTFPLMIVSNWPHFFRTVVGSNTSTGMILSGASFSRKLINFFFISAHSPVSCLRDCKWEKKKNLTECVTYSNICPPFASPIPGKLTTINYLLVKPHIDHEMSWNVSIFFKTASVHYMS